MELPTIYKIECKLEEAAHVIEKAEAFGAKEFNRDVLCDEGIIRIFFRRVALLQHDD
jgi:hypothetical protein